MARLSRRGFSAGAIRLAISISLAVWSGACYSTEVTQDEPWPLVYAEDFETPDALEGFAFSDPTRWVWNESDGRTSLELLGKSKYAPPFRSPTSIALVPELVLGDFDLEVGLLQTGRNYGHRDMCLFFGFQSPSRYYYVHLATSPDPNAHNIFRVADAARTNLAPVVAEGIDWGSEVWHRVRIERRVTPGTIRVFWDGAAEPIIETLDTTFDWGRIGFGSFDDTGRIASVRVWAPATQSPLPDRQPFAEDSTP